MREKGNISVNYDELTKRGKRREVLRIPSVDAIVESNVLALKNMGAHTRACAHLSVSPYIYIDMDIDIDIFLSVCGYILCIFPKDVKGGELILSISRRTA